MADISGLVFNIQKYSIHDGPGIRTSVFLKGCPLCCVWCSNPESQSPKPQPLGDGPDSRLYTVHEVVEICCRDLEFYEESGGGVTLSGGEPLTQPGFVCALLPALRAKGIHTAIETTGHVAPDVFIKSARLADLLLFDIKHHDPKKHREGTDADNTLILKNLKAAAVAGIDILLRIPVIPDYNDSPDDAKAFALLLNELGICRAQLLPFHQMGDRKYTLLGWDYAYRGIKALYPEDLEEFKAVFINNEIDAFF
jgi:glycyl-radical enzyme activating protein family